MRGPRSLKRLEQGQFYMMALLIFRPASQSRAVRHDQGQHHKYSQGYDSSKIVKRTEKAYGLLMDIYLLNGGEALEFGDRLPQMKLRSAEDFIEPHACSFQNEGLRLDKGNLT